MLAGAGPDVEQVVGRPHRALVVLDHEHGVPEVAQPLERRDQPLVVALVQADRRLVEDVEHPDQRRADLRRQPDPLRLAARQRAGRAVHREVADADVVQEPQPLVDLAQDQPRDRAVLVRQGELLQPGQRAPRALRRELVDRQPADLDRPRLRPQPRALALRARPHRHVLLDLLARPVRVGLPVAALEVRHDALEARHVRALAAHAVAVGDVQPIAVRAVQEQVLLVLRQVEPGLVEVDLVALGDRLRDLLVVARRPARPRQDRALVERERRVRHHEVRVDLHLRAEPGAARACAVRRVERERARLELRHREPAVQAGELLGVRRGRDLSAVARHGHDLDDPVGERDRGLHRVGQALAQVAPHHQPVDHDRDVVLELLVEHDLLFQQPQLAVDLHAGEALGAQLVELLAVLALAAAHDRCHDHEPLAVVHRHDLVDDLLGRLGGDLAPAVEAERLADARPQQPQVVVDLRDRADRRPRVARRRLLVDRDRRRQALDRVHVRLVHLPEELARVRAQRLDVAALALRVDRVEGQRRLTGPRQAGDDDERVARQLDRHVFEVVLPCAGDDDASRGRHKSPLILRCRTAAESNTRSHRSHFAATV